MEQCCVEYVADRSLPLVCKKPSQNKSRAVRCPAPLTVSEDPTERLPLSALAALFRGLFLRLGLRLLGLFLRGGFLRLLFRFGFRFRRGLPGRRGRSFHALVLFRLFLDDYLFGLFDDVAGLLSLLIFELRELVVFIIVHLGVEHFFLRRVLNSSPHLIGLSEFCQAAGRDRRDSKCKSQEGCVANSRKDNSTKCDAAHN